MPWRGPSLPGEFPTLGYLVADWIEAHCVIPDGDFAGEPYALTDEMVRFLLWFYRLDPVSGRFWFLRGGQLVRPQKWGKGPFLSAIVCAEAEGPVVPDGWDASGEPVGRPWATPWIQITALVEDQTDNVYRALQPMIELGPLAQLIPDTGETRINLRGGGRIEPVTSKATSRLGQRLTFAPQDETSLWTRENGGRRLADTQRRNLAPMGGRFLETTNCWNPAENSVAQQTWESPAAGVYKDKTESPAGSFRNKRERRKVLRAVYGDSWWVTKNLERVEAEIDELMLRDPGQAERFYGNRIVAAEGAAFDLDAWKRAAKGHEKHRPPDGALIVLGVDGARFRDALAVIGTEVTTGHQWPIGIWERPQDAPDDYEHPFDEIDGLVTEAFDTWQVWRAYCDPQYIEGLIERWQGRWGDKRVLEWFTNRHRQIAWAVRNYTTAIGAGDLTNDGDPVMARHIGAAQRQLVRVYDDEGIQMHTISKDASNSPHKIDAAMGGVLSWEARGDAIASGAELGDMAIAIVL